jgi:hypothetical protein
VSGAAALMHAVFLGPFQKAHDPTRRRPQAARLEPAIACILLTNMSPSNP